MKQLILLSFFIVSGFGSMANNADTLKTPIPYSRIGFHDKIDNEQETIDKLDGKHDKMWNATKNEDFNLHISDALYRRVDDLQNWIEANESIVSNNDKVRYLRYIEDLLQTFYKEWRVKAIKPIEFV